MTTDREAEVGDFVTLVRGTTYKGALVTQPKQLLSSSFLRLSNIGRDRKIYPDRRRFRLS